MELNKKEYDNYVKNVTPVHPLWPGMIRAFVTGGAICALAQCSTMIMMKYWGLDKDTSAAWTQLELILCSIILTGFNIYPKIVQWGGAGALVPITGFANSVVAPAIEYKAEGHVFGIGCKIFTIAGPVILFGVFTSWVLGVIWWMMQVIGIVQA